MKPSRLVAFGCSNTYGLGLDDIWPHRDVAQTTPSKFAWPQILGDSLKIETNNCGIPGSSNKQILHTILNFEFKEDDIVVVCWSHVNRDIIIEKDNDGSDGEYIQIGPWWQASMKDRRQILKNKSYYKHMYHRHNSVINSFYYYNLAHYYLKEKQIKHAFTHINPSYLSSKTFSWDISNPIFLNCFIEKENSSKDSLYDDVGCDGAHPGKETHKRFALSVLSNLFIKRLL